MTGYNANEMDGWEFKIVRANTRKFKNPEAIRQLCDEEAKAGWEMVEKFDDQRIRFKRPVEKRSGDQYLDIDPYRTQFGMSEGHIVAIVLGVLLVVGGIAALISGSTAAWIAGGVTGGVIFTLVLVLPLVFLAGLCEVFLSSTWTLTYRQLHAMQVLDPAPLPQTGPQADQAPA